MPHDLSITLAGLLYHCPVSLSTIGSQDVSHQKDFCSPQAHMPAQGLCPEAPSPGIQTTAFITETLRWRPIVSGSGLKFSPRFLWFA